MAALESKRSAAPVVIAASRLDAAEFWAVVTDRPDRIDSPEHRSCCADPLREAGNLAGSPPKQPKLKEDRAHTATIVGGLRVRSVLTLLVDVEEEDELIERSGRNARTLLKDGPLRVTLVVLGSSGELAEHAAAGPITIQVVEGRIGFSAGDDEHDLGPGQLLAVGPRIRHRVTSDDGAAFLLTVSQPERRE